MNEDFVSMHCAVWKKLEQQMGLLDSFRHAREDTSDTVKNLSIELMEVHSGILQAMTDQTNSLDAGIQKLEHSTTQCPDALSRTKEEIKALHDSLQGALSEQKHMLEGVVHGTINKDIEALGESLQGALAEQRHFLEGLAGGTSNEDIKAMCESLQGASTEQKQLLQGVVGGKGNEDIKAMCESLHAALTEQNHLVQSVVGGTANADTKAMCESLQGTLTEQRQLLEALVGRTTSEDIRAVSESLQGALTEQKQLLKGIAGNVAQEKIAEVLTSLTEELTDMRTAFLDALSQHQSKLSDVSDHVRQASQSVAATTGDEIATASMTLKEQQVLLDGFESKLQQMPPQAAAAVKAEVLEMRSMLIDAVTQKLQSDGSRPSFKEVDRQKLTQIEGEMAQLQSACLEALGEQKMKLEEICGNISGAPAAPGRTDSEQKEADVSKVGAGDESQAHAHAQFAEVLKAEVADIRSMLTDVRAHQSTKDDDTGREMRTKIQDGLTNMFSMVLEALTQLTLLQDEVMRGLRPEHPRKAVITSSGEFIDVRAVVEEVLDQYSILKEEHAAENQMVQAELKQMTSKMTEALDRQKSALDLIRMEQESPEALESVKKELLNIRTVFSEMAHDKPLQREEVQEQAVAAVKEELLSVRSMILEALAQLHGEHDELGRELRSIMEEGLVHMHSAMTESEGRRPSLADELSERTPVPGAADLTGDSEAEAETGGSSFTNIFF
mmetsp:Transcript_33317/g.59236  ORF Transcript_33317/g.59236 Transcript_33317/m.59236 type:complete len:726 (-) Transcript_33317:49-2226(-)